MCWTSNDKPECLVAEEDIRVYKMVRAHLGGKILSYFNEFSYEINKLYNTNIVWGRHKDKCNDFYFINQGFHSYCHNLKTRFNIPLHTCIALAGPNTIYTGIGVFEMLCIIPKGTKYYVNEFGEVVSTHIKPIALSTKELRDLKEGECFEYKIHL